MESVESSKLVRQIWLRHNPEFLNSNLRSKYRHARLKILEESEPLNARDARQWYVSLAQSWHSAAPRTGDATPRAPARRQCASLPAFGPAPAAAPTAGSAGWGWGRLCCSPSALSSCVSLR